MTIPCQKVNLGLLHDELADAKQFSEFVSILYMLWYVPDLIFVG